jgi:hypothetical protein
MQCWRTIGVAVTAQDIRRVTFASTVAQRRRDHPGQRGGHENRVND